MQVINPFFNTQTTISDVDQLADRLLALSDKDAQLISDILSLTENDTSMLTTINQQASTITQQSNDIAKLKTDVSNAQALASASSENLLINPRGKINQANESDGVLAAGVYFCDGWKAGANGAEVYRDVDGFRLVSGSIVQLVPNNVEPNQTLRGNLTTVSGTPQIKINGGTDSAQSDSAEYIQFEVSGDNSKFTKLVLAESAELPIYRQQADELTACLSQLREFAVTGRQNSDGGTHKEFIDFNPMISNPAVIFVYNYADVLSAQSVSRTRVFFASQGGYAGAMEASGFLDARP
ncbi:hypothetical protein [Vibrio sonorensis]|uniref:hypothetical protein n=1 Tax=Vibrio sonorensis TaxID=1004316 RepID=UPI0008D94F57|nr:hypothetical protein [Vibrio sonorensis]